MKLVMLRHATRNSHSPGDVPLNRSGQLQAHHLIKAIAPEGSLPLPTRLLCSPKRRARETLAPTSSQTGVSLQIDARLDERRTDESIFDFENRVRSLIDELPRLCAPSDGGPSDGVQSDGVQSDGAIWLCSHLDWLESALIFLPSDLNDVESAMSWMTCEYRKFSLKNGVWLFEGGGRAEESL